MANNDPEKDLGRELTFSLDGRLWVLNPVFTRAGGSETQIYMKEVTSANYGHLLGMVQLEDHDQVVLSLDLFPPGSKFEELISPKMASIQKEPLMNALGSTVRESMPQYVGELIEKAMARGREIDGYKVKLYYPEGVNKIASKNMGEQLLQRLFLTEDFEVLEKGEDEVSGSPDKRPYIVAKFKLRQV